ncbi:hypothetical protein BJP40_07055 [Streptomyces sp. CC53]|uniref:hypothetical protein n=1 Tax=unclassified Streptomyces TaxID=2593676 RepID=UPI0008DCF9AD|nr:MULTISPECIES: hypothetical protein [unclassified Streptomyces]OII61106.1 hypothetical protein BJP40_07055 [Streptomyces sp. CC53]
MSGEFEGKSLDALYAMIRSAKPGDLTKAGNALEAASPQIIKIATDLRVYFDKVQWEGAGGDGFRLWGADMVSETLKLSDFTTTVGQEMQRAGQALSEAQKSMPEPAGQCYADPEKEQARIKDETGPKLQEAIRQMERLTSYYKTAKTRMESEEEPQFAPPEWTYKYIQGSPYGDGGSGAPSGGATTYSQSGSGPSSFATQHYPSGPSSTGSASAGSGGLPAAGPENRLLPEPGTVPLPHEPVGTKLDSVITTPVQEAVGRGGIPPASTQPTGPGTGGPALLPPVAPVTGPHTGSQPSRGPVAPGIGAPRGPLPGGTGPLGLPRVGAPDGIHGGQAVTGRGGTSPLGPRLPTGTVVGEERGALGRGPMGMGGPGAGFQGGSGAAGGPGRRLAAQPGGTVGGTPASGAVGRGPFTPGGTGLVRPPASTTAGSAQRREAAARPDYLTEDEETWTAGRRSVVPPVID